MKREKKKTTHTRVKQMVEEKKSLTYQSNFKGQNEIRLTRFHSAWDRNMMKPLTIITTWLNTQVATADLRQLVFGCYARLSECVKQNPDGVQRVSHPRCGVGGSTAA